MVSAVLPHLKVLVLPDCKAEVGRADEWLVAKQNE
jgi:hypothetical protein